MQTYNMRGETFLYMVVVLAIYHPHDDYLEARTSLA